ncbi:MAG: ATP-binding protein, partial [Gemmatimonadota bacterium]
MIIGFLIAAAGIMIWSGVLHTAIGLRRVRDPVNLSFGFTALAFAAFTLTGVALARNTTLPGAERLIFFKTTFAILAWLGVIGFSWAFLRRGRAWPWLVAMVVAALVLHLTVPGGIYLERVLAIRRVVLPWNEEVQRAIPLVRPYALPVVLAIAGSLANVIKRAVIAYRTELGHRPVIFLVGMAILALALVDDLVQATALTYALDESAMLVFTLLMGTYLVEDAADTAEARYSARMSLRRLQNLLDTAPEAILIYDCQSGTFVNSNLPARELLGVELRGRPLLEFSTRALPVQDDGYASVDRARAVMQGAAKGEAQLTEWSVVNAGGEVIPCELRAVPLTAPEGQLVRVSLIDMRPLRDADHRRQLAEEQLHHAQRLEALGQMTSRIAHDLSNILTPIMARADLALERYGEVDPALREDLEEIVGASERARELAVQVLGFSRKSRGKANASDVTNVVRSMMSLFRTAAPPGVVVQSVLKETCVAQMSRQHVEQVVSNLAVNAIHACGEQGHVRITVGCTRVQGPLAERHPDFPHSTAVRIAVEDDGSGIPPHLLKRILAPYYTTKGDEGTGLGLAIVSDLVRDDDGSMAVESAVDVGTTFEILLPLVGQEPGALSVTESAPSAAWSGRA